MIYSCRLVKPTVGSWIGIEANSPGEAANEFHCTHMAGTISYRPENGSEGVSFALVEVEDHGDFVSRMYYLGIGRAGGVRRPQPTLKQIAEMLGWERDPEELLEPGWLYEETMEEAQARVFGK